MKGLDDTIRISSEQKKEERKNDDKRIRTPEGVSQIQKIVSEPSDRKSKSHHLITTAFISMLCVGCEAFNGAFVVRMFAWRH
jgi:hypothetical protein